MLIMICHENPCESICKTPLFLLLKILIFCGVPPVMLVYKPSCLVRIIYHKSNSGVFSTKWATVSSIRNIPWNPRMFLSEILIFLWFSHSFLVNSWFPYGFPMVFLPTTWAPECQAAPWAACSAWPPAAKPLKTCWARRAAKPREAAANGKNLRVGGLEHWFSMG